MNRSIHTVLIDESDLLREGLLRILSRTRFRVIADCRSLNDVSVSLASTDEQCMMVIGVDSESASALAELPSIKARHQHLRVVMLGDRFDPEQLLAAVELGADCYMLKKQLSAEALVKSMDLVFLGGIVLPHKFIQLFRDRLRSTTEITPASYGNINLMQPWPLTSAPQEIEVDASLRFSAKERSILKRLTQGESNKIIARELRTAEATVKVHMKAILRKIGVQNRTQAAMWAVNNMRTSDNGV